VPNGVWKKVLKEGTSLFGDPNEWQHPEDGDEVLMHYMGKLEDGTVFDSSRERGEPFKFTLGKKSVIAGWEIAARTMKKGEQAILTLSPDYAYGSSGSPPKIPPNATLTFDLELVSWVSLLDVFSDGTVIKKVLEEGEGWERPGKMSEVTVKVSIKTDSQVVLQDYMLTFNFHVDDPRVNPLIEAVVKNMKKGSKVLVKAKGPRAVWNGVTDPNTTYAEYTIELVGWLKVEDITKDGGVVKKVLIEGDGWERPNEGATCIVTGYGKVASSGEVFEEFKERKIIILNGSVLDALESAILTMKRGERALFSIKSDYGYKTALSIKPANVSVDDDLIFELQLVSFEKAKETWSMNFEEKVQVMKEKKEMGNHLFAQNRLRSAIKLYEKAIGFFEYSTSELPTDIRSEVNVLLVQCHLNLAACYEKENNYEKVLQHCAKALDIEPGNLKALYRQGNAYMMTEEYFKAESALKYALEFHPTNTAVATKLRELKARQKERDAKDKKMFRSIFASSITE